MFSEDVSYAADRLKELVGWQIVGTVTTEDRESYGFIVQRDPHGKPIERKTCWIDCDPEGNGPGWIAIEEFNHEPEEQTAAG